MLRRWLPVFAALSVLALGAAACEGASDDALNPQPLPPADGKDGAQSPGSNGGTSGSSGGGGPPPVPTKTNDSDGGDAGPEDAGGDT